MILVDRVVIIFEDSLVVNILYIKRYKKSCIKKYKSNCKLMPDLSHYAINIVYKTSI